ncbi:CHAT domain-containing protein [Aspergillus navahoensis]
MDKLHLIGNPVFSEVIHLMNSRDAANLEADLETLMEIGFNLGLAHAGAGAESPFTGLDEERRKLKTLAIVSAYLLEFKGAAEEIADGYDDDSPRDPASYFDAGAFIMGQRFMQGKEMDNWEERVFSLGAATSCLELAGSLTPANQPSKRAIRAYWLSGIHEHLFDLTADPDRIAWSIAETERALSVAPDHPESGIWRGALASRLFKQHELSQNKEHLSKAFRIIRDLIAHEQTAGMVTTTHLLAISLHKHYERTGDTESLEAATIFAERAAKAAELSWGLPDLGIKSDQFMRITYINSKSAASPPVNHTISSICLSRYIRFRDMEDLEKGISVTEQALQSTAEETSSYPALQTSFGRMLLHQYLVTEDSEELEKAMSSAKSAIQAYNTLMESDPVFTALAAGRGHSQAHKLQGDLYAVKWQLRHYFSEGYGARLHYQIALGWAADDQEHYRKQYECLHSLAKHISAEEGHETIGGSTTEVDLLGTLFKLAENRAAPALVRIQSARLALRLLGQRGNWDEASAGAQEALKLLSQICGRFMKREDQQYAIAQTSGLAADACSVALEAGNVPRALEVVEFGRGLIMGYLMDARAELGRLRQKHPELAERYETLLARASVPIATGSRGRQEELLSERVEAVTQLEETLEHLQRKGFFLQPTPAELQRHAAEGPIVIVNITDLGSDAIIIAEEEIQAIALPEMTLGQVPSTLRARIGSFRGLDIRGEMAYADRDLATDLDDDATTTTDSGILHWLWSTCVSKVLAKLRAMRVLPSRDTRVWWMGTGVASGLPFHAAGRHVPGSTETTLDHCIPSYTPGIKALGYARECVSRAAAQLTPTGQTPTTTSILVVAMPTTPGYTPLDGVRAETAAIQCLAELPDSKLTSKHRVLRYSVRTLEHPSQEDTLSEMGNHDIIHFACHGMSDPTNPSGSHLLLQRATCASGEEEDEDENKSAVVDPLTASNISNSNSLGRAWIAYLSACSTAQVRADAFVDENIHLASAFQVAGFAHVIGTLWRADDRACVRLVLYFYTALANKPDMRTTGAVASLLRESVLELRQHFIDMPSSWAPFVYFRA